MTAALTVRGLTKSFIGKRVIREVDLDIEPGRVVGVVGPNGSGKTTLFSLIAGFLQPDAGTIELAGATVSSAGAHCGKIGILPQDAAFLPQISIKAQFRWYGQLMGLGKAAAAREAERVLRLTAMTEAGAKSGSQLSHGMHKRAAIAQAFIGEPPVLVLDEPTAGLDPANARVLRELIDAQCGQRTVLVSSHNLEEIADLCDYITVFDHGRLVTAETMRSFTGEQGVLTFTLAQPAPDSLIEGFMARLEISDVQTNADRTRIACRMPAQYADDPEEIAALLSLIQTEGGAFYQLTKGTTVEDRFFEVTRGQGATTERD